MPSTASWDQRSAGSVWVRPAVCFHTFPLLFVFVKMFWVILFTTLTCEHIQLRTLCWFATIYSNVFHLNTFIINVHAVPAKRIIKIIYFSNVICSNFLRSKIVLLFTEMWPSETTITFNRFLWFLHSACAFFCSKIHRPRTKPSAVH